MVTEDQIQNPKDNKSVVALLKKLLLLKTIRDVRHPIKLIKLDITTYETLCAEMHDMYLDRFSNIRVEQILTTNLLIEIE